MNARSSSKPFRVQDGMPRSFIHFVSGCQAKKALISALYKPPNMAEIFPSRNFRWFSRPRRSVDRSSFIESESLSMDGKLCSAQLNARANTRITAVKKDGEFIFLIDN
ncbi:unnamed protein product, partial [Heterosigma akashiwo]